VKGFPACTRQYAHIGGSHGGSSCDLEVLRGQDRRRRLSLPGKGDTLYCRVRSATYALLFLSRSLLAHSRGPTPPLWRHVQREPVRVAGRQRPPAGDRFTVRSCCRDRRMTRRRTTRGRGKVRGPVKDAVKDLCSGCSTAVTKDLCNHCHSRFMLRTRRLAFFAPSQHEHVTRRQLLQQSDCDARP
jgi:hypothetical protein